MALYLRKVKLKVGGLSINDGGLNLHDLKIGFRVTKGLSSSQNTAEIKIWNLSESSRKACGKELANVELEAGYINDAIGLIFKGQVRDVEHKREAEDIITTISCGDGDKAFGGAKISKTYPKGTEVKDVVEDLYAELEAQGVDRGEWKFPDDLEPFKRPYTVCGSCKRELDQLGRGKKFYWSLQNETMEIIPSDGYIGGVITLSPRTGLVDTPTITDNGVKFKALLNPEVRPNRRVRIESETLEMNAENGEYRVSECTFSGDNRQGDFHVSGTGESVDGSKVDEGPRRRG